MTRRIFVEFKNDKFVNYYDIKNFSIYDFDKELRITLNDETFIRIFLDNVLYYEIYTDYNKENEIYYE